MSKTPPSQCRVQFLVRELDPTCHKKDLLQSNKYLKKKERKKNQLFGNQDFPGGPEYYVPNAGAWIQLLVRELDPHVTTKT